MFDSLRMWRKEVKERQLTAEKVQRNQERKTEYQKYKELKDKEVQEKK